MSVQNVLQGILSQKVVAAGSGYAVKNDLVNIDNIASTGIITGTIGFTSGTAGGPNGLSSQLKLNGYQIINNTDITLNGLGNIDMSGRVLSDSTSTQTTGVKLGSNLDLKGNLIVSNGTYSGSGPDYSKYVKFGAPIDLNNHELTTSTGQIDFGTDATLSGHDFFDIGSMHLSSTSTQAGTISITSNTSVTLSVTGVTTTSIVVVTPKTNPSAYYWVTTGTGSITINTSAATTTTFNYYIAKY